jgi:hypothetical protein
MKIEILLFILIIITLFCTKKTCQKRREGFFDISKINEKIFELEDIDVTNLKMIKNTKRFLDKQDKKFKYFDKKIKQNKFSINNIMDISVDVGPRGPRGPRGDRGPAGDRGPPKGPKGDRGPTGDCSICNPYDLIGKKGDKGPTGKRGKTGKRGDKGKDSIVINNPIDGSSGSNNVQTMLSNAASLFTKQDQPGTIKIGEMNTFVRLPGNEIIHVKGINRGGWTRWGDPFPLPTHAHSEKPPLPPDLTPEQKAKEEAKRKEMEEEFSKMDTLF